MIALSLPMWLGKVPPNRFYGARFRQSYISDKNWYQINKVTARYLMIWAVALMLLNLGVLLLATSQTRWLVLFVALTPFILLLATAQAWALARRMG